MRRGRALSGSPREPSHPLLACVDRTLELLLVHARATGDPHPLRLVVERVLRAPALAAPSGAQAAATTGRDVGTGQPGRRLRLAGPRTFLVDGTGGDLLRALRRATLLLLALLDVLVLTLALLRPGLLRHGSTSFTEVNAAVRSSVTRSARCGRRCRPR